MITGLEWAEVERLSEHFWRDPTSMSRADLDRYEDLCTRVANDPDSSEARRLACILQRASVAYWRVRHERP